jgi:uncharacterized protein YbaR (Trm112 family)
MEETLLELLCTPLSHGALRAASSAELSQINGALICDSERSSYPIRDGFPVLISGEAFDWPQD